MNPRVNRRSMGGLIALLFAAIAGCVAGGAYDGGVDVGYGVDFYDAGGYEYGGWGPGYGVGPIDQHRRRDPCRRCRGVRAADRRAEQVGAIIGGGDYSGLRPRITRTSTTTTAITRRIWMKPPKVCDDTIPSSHKINSSIAIVSSNFISSPQLQHGRRAPGSLYAGVRR